MSKATELGLNGGYNLEADYEPLLVGEYYSHLIYNAFTRKNLARSLP